jgi:tetratricopeptide (TPR) repeat protein
MKTSISVRVIVMLLALAGLNACTTQKKSEGTTEPEAVSFSGKFLFAKPAAENVQANSDSIIASLNSKGDLAEDDYLEIGKQLAATARYKRAVQTYTEGLEKYPDSYKLLRNRGHRYITLRKLDKALNDLQHAEELIRNEADVMEYGMDGKPTATVRHQIWYHLGVYYYLVKDYGLASSSFEKALETAGDPKNSVGASDWLYNCYQRLGETEKAKLVIQPITENYLDDKEQPYFKRIMLYKGILTPEQLIDINKKPEDMTVQDITLLYGLANCHAYKGDKEKANEIYRIILKSDAWPGFAYAAAEKDINLH